MLWPLTASLGSQGDIYRGSSKSSKKKAFPHIPVFPPPGWSLIHWMGAKFLIVHRQRIFMMHLLYSWKLFPFYWCKQSILHSNVHFFPSLLSCMLHIIFPTTFKRKRVAQRSSEQSRGTCTLFQKFIFCPKIQFWQSLKTSQEWVKMAKSNY